MKERPILFSGDMVRAILDGRKTMTRRIIKFKFLLNKCPYGTIGDRLWVRETIFQKSHYQVAYGEDASPEDGWWWDQNEVLAYLADGKYTGTESGRVRPSIHMPRWASRITLEITNIRVERLNDISEGDAEAEGVDFIRYAPDFDETLTAKDLFEVLWESINGSGSWEKNPWVWCISFRRAK